MKNLPFYPASPPLVSVITATYNRQHTLAACIESVASQTVKNLEHLIIDDGSEDATFDLVQQYMREDPRIRYAKHSNRGQSLSLNVGLMMAAGEFSCILDSDDYYLPNHVESRLAYLQENPGIDFVYGGLKVIGDEYVADAEDPRRKIHIDQCSGTCTFFCPNSGF